MAEWAPWNGQVFIVIPVPIETLAAPSDTLRVSSNTMCAETGPTNYTKQKEIRLTRIKGRVRVKFDICTSVDGQPVYARIYKNQEPVGTEQSTTSEVFITKAQDIWDWVPGDLLQLYMRSPEPGIAVGVRNLRVYFDEALCEVIKDY